MTRSPRVWAMAAVVALVAALVVLLVRDGEQSLPTDFERLSAAADQPGVPLLVPVALPDGVELLDLGPSSVRAGTALNRRLSFSSAGESVVEVCVHEQAEPACGDAGAHGDAARVSRTQGGQVIVVNLLRPESDPAFWEQVELTTDLRRAAWLK